MHTFVFFLKKITLWTKHGPTWIFICRAEYLQNLLFTWHASRLIGWWSPVTFVREWRPRIQATSSPSTTSSDWDRPKRPTGCRYHHNFSVPLFSLGVSHSAPRHLGILLACWGWFTSCSWLWQIYGLCTGVCRNIQVHTDSTICAIFKFECSADTESCLLRQMQQYRFDFRLNIV